MNKTTQQIAMPILSLILVANSASLQAAPQPQGREISTQHKVNQQKKSAELETEEKVGLGLGAVIGGIFGGPPGAFITAIAGNFIGKHMVSEEHKEEMQGEILAQQQALAKAEHKHQLAMKQAEQEMDDLIASYEKNAALQAENILMSLLFRTGSSEIEPQYEQQVNALAQILKQAPNLSIDLQGYTDKQGEAENNLALSEKRVESVKQLLLAQGIGEERIVTQAHGEMAPLNAQQPSEINYFDRRVVMRLKNNSQAVAKK